MNRLHREAPLPIRPNGKPPAADGKPLPQDRMGRPDQARGGMNGRAA